MREVEVDKYGVLRFRTSVKRIAVAQLIEWHDAGYSVELMAPSETWHKQWAAFAWGTPPN